LLTLRSRLLLGQMASVPEWTTAGSGAATAFEDARRACEPIGRRQPHLLDTLAAAYAELGDFDQAVASPLRAQPLFQEEWAFGVGRDRPALSQA
jgi:hypothetical protein